MSHSLAALAESTYERLGDYESLWFEGRAFRSGELFARARRLAAGLTELGLREGDRVVVEQIHGLTLSVRRAEEWELQP